jgi:quercetin dioxygenase-like cupin family protein
MRNFPFRPLLAAGLACCALSAPAGAYERSGQGLRVLENADGVAITMLVEAANLGGAEVEIGRIVIPAGYRSAAHAHGANEIFYVLSGEMEHVVNGESHRIRPGMVAIVRAGDEVVHRVPGEAPCEALVVWAPGGEAARLSQRFTVKPLE